MLLRALLRQFGVVSGLFLGLGTLVVATTPAWARDCYICVPNSGGADCEPIGPPPNFGWKWCLPVGTDCLHGSSCFLTISEDLDADGTLNASTQRMIDATLSVPSPLGGELSLRELVGSSQDANVIRNCKGFVIGSFLKALQPEQGLDASTLIL